MQSFAGLLLDLASDLVSARDPALGSLGQSLTARVRPIQRTPVTRTTAAACSCRIWPTCWSPWIRAVRS